MPKYKRGAIFLLCGAITLAVMALAPAAPAPAQDLEEQISDKQAEVDSLKSEIGSINMAAEQAVERYNLANIELESIQEQLILNEEALSGASARLEEAQIRLAGRVRNIYREGSLNFIDVMLSTSSFGEFISRIDLLGRIGQQDRSYVDEVLRYRNEVAEVQAGLEYNQQQQEELLAAVANEKAEVEYQLANRESVLSEAEDDVAELVAEQIREQERAAAAAAAAAREAAESQAESAYGEGDFPEAPPVVYGGDVVSIAEQYLGVPYVWGGASPRGFDCSGLVMYVYAQVGVYLPHFAASQYYAGTPISGSELAPGDLVFFGSPISHVGIYVGGGTMIDANFAVGMVTYSSIDGYVAAARIE